MVMQRVVAALVGVGLFISSVEVVAAPPPPDPKVDPSSKDIKEARRLFDSGQELFDDASYDAAIQAFRRAFALSGSSNCLFNIALAYDRTGDYDGALEYLQYYRVYAKNPDMADFEKTKSEVEERKAIADEEARLRAEAEEEDDEFDEDDELPPPPPDDPRPERQPIFSGGAIAATAVAAVGLGVGIGLGVVSQRRKDEASSACDLDPDGDRFCPGVAEEPLNDSRRFALGADIAFGIGAAAALAAVIIVAVRAGRNKRAQTAVTPLRRGAALVVHF